jgi:F420-dependent methylenetetrahydromethanopterin dehydrogenase
MGGVVAFNINGTSEKGDCVLMQEIEIPVCDGKGKQVDELPKQNIIFIAPNPAKTSTTLHYQLITEGAVTVELYDAMGRTIWQTLEKENKGSIVIDCEKYAEGYYRVLVKQNGAIIHQSKLIIKQ